MNGYMGMGYKLHECEGVMIPASTRPNFGFEIFIVLLSTPLKTQSTPISILSPPGFLCHPKLTQRTSPASNFRQIVNTKMASVYIIRRYLFKPFREYIRYEDLSCPENTDILPPPSGFSFAGCRKNHLRHKTRRHPIQSAHVRDEDAVCTVMKCDVGINASPVSLKYPICYTIEMF